MRVPAGFAVGTKPPFQLLNVFPARYGHAVMEEVFRCDDNAGPDLPVAPDTGDTARVYAPLAHKAHYCSASGEDLLLFVSIGSQTVLQRIFEKGFAFDYVA